MSSAGTLKRLSPTGCKGEKTAPISQFANELWYQKGYKYLAAQEAERSKSGTPGGNDTAEELDPEFVLQRLIRPTASSRSRQVTHWPAASYTHSSGAAQSKQNSGPSAMAAALALCRPNRFKGTRSVSSKELRDIVNRLSACDPASVPDSGLSRSRGKGFGEWRSGKAAWTGGTGGTGASVTTSRSVKARPAALYVRGFAEELNVRRSRNDITN
ncbi:uncharacterized protein LOC143289578 [Babylonia areolata]|uniref:uncharacterized protein LOC143289578 n=1 Tax=Babylonia areolata TaxID=304850 RepID=UPI003FD50613